MYFGMQLISVGSILLKKNLNVGPVNRPAFCWQVPPFLREICPSKNIIQVGRSAMNRPSSYLGIGETGYGCHTFYITDVFRNIVITADIRLLLCLNIVSCAHINMQFVIFTS